MSEHRYTITSDASHEIELLLTRFERDRENGPVDLADYAPPADDPAHNSVLTELARIDLEYGFDDGSPLNAMRYIERFPLVFADPHLRTQIAFEEYRLRRRAGEDVASEAVGKKYDVDGSRWPKMKLGAGRAGANRSVSRRFTERDLLTPSVHYPSVGDTFAGYPLITRIGEGAFSRVFLARQPDLASRLIVLKVTPLSMNESDQLARLQHSAIIPVYSVHRQGDLCCICMPFLGATTLADLSTCSRRWASLDGPAEELISTILDRRKSTVRTMLDEPAVANIAKKRDQQPDDIARVVSSSAAADPGPGLAQYAKLGYVDALLELVIRSVEGLAYAHSHGIIHRDLKPANILVSDDGNPVLLDFNLAVSSHDPTTQIVGGTLPYMSPQQLEALQTGAAADMRDDLFSMGVILYELLSGQLPFACPTGGEAFELESVIADRRARPKSVRSFNQGVSPGLAAIIDRCIAPDREQRYQTGAELLEDLNRHRQQRPLKFATDRSISERIAKWSARHPRLSSASSVAFIAAVILLVCAMLIWQRGQRIARLKVESNYQQWQTQLPEAIAALSTPGREPELLSSGLAKSSQMMKQWQVGSDNWKNLTDFERLDNEAQNRLSRQLAKLAYMMANAEYHVALQTKHPDQDALIEKSRYWNRLAGTLHPSLQLLADLQAQQISLKLDWIQPDKDRLGTASGDDNLDLRAMLAADSGDTEAWRKLLEVQLDRQPTNASHWFQLAIVHGRLGDADAAAACFDVANRMQPRSIAILLNRGICNLQRGQCQPARSDFSACLRLNSSLMVPRFNRAVASYRLADFEAALDDLNQLIQRDQVTTRTMLMRARVYDALGNPDAAAADRQTALDIPPHDADDWVARGVSRLEDSPAAALADFLSALRVRPADVNALQNAAHVYAERLDDPQQAIQMLNRLAAIRPKSAAVAASRGIMHARIGNMASALANAQTASKLSAGGLEQFQIAGIYALAGDSEKKEAYRDDAFSWLARALRSDLQLVAIASSDPDLASLRDDPRFGRLVENASIIQSLSQPADR